MEPKTNAVPAPLEKLRSERVPLREEMRPARGLLVGLALSAISWLGLLVLWLAY